MIEPQHGDARHHFALALAAVRSDDPIRAVREYRLAIESKPGLTVAYIQLGNQLLRIGCPAEAVEAFRAALDLRPEVLPIWSGWLFAQHYLEDLDAQDLARAHQAFAAAVSNRISPAFRTAKDKQDPLIRIGFVSANFTRHSVGYFVEPILREIDRARFQVYGYSVAPKSDYRTAVLRPLFTEWREVAALSAADLARVVRDDNIDILVDLGGHTTDNRLETFAYRPAPVQVTWIGYPNTTGLSAIDYRITDAVADPPGPSDEWASEKLWRLPGCFLCYQPPADVSDWAPDPPTRAAVTFGSFNNLNKVNARVIRVWAAILQATPGAQLLLKADALSYESVRRRVHEAFAAVGVSSSRVELLGWEKDVGEHLRLYDHVDIALDTFPYNGTTTTLEALWMSVPVVTMCGSSHVARVGASLLHHAGLDELITSDEAGYIATTVGLTQDRGRRMQLRQSMRDRLRATPLFDSAAFARNLEVAFVQMLDRSERPAGSDMTTTGVTN